MAPIDVHLLRSTRSLTTWVVALLCLWGFGTLYELNGALGALVRGPKPGALVGAFDAGSPCYYFVPASPLALVLSVVLAFRTRHTSIAGRTAAAAGLVTVAACATAVLVSSVNPQFRDPQAEGLGTLTLIWLAGNTLRIACVAAAVSLLLSWRRIEQITTTAEHTQAARSTCHQRSAHSSPRRHQSLS